MTTYQDGQAILTDARGVPFERPMRDAYPDAVAFVRAFHAWRDAVSAAARAGFEAGWRGALRP